MRKRTVYRLAPPSGAVQARKDSGRMRLIDSDELIKRIEKWMPKDPCGREQTVEEIVATDIAVSVCMEIEETPTAFDKEKVHRELIELRNAEICRPDSMNKYDESWSHGRYSAFLDAIRIVEKGGIG